MPEIRVERVVPGTVEQTWSAFTDAESLTAWFWPRRLAPVVDVDLRVGGSFRVASESAGLAVSGVYQRIETAARLVFTWRWDGADEETLVTVALDPVDDVTGVTVLHERFPDDEAAAMHEQGWNDCLDRLATPADPPTAE